MRTKRVYYILFTDEISAICNDIAPGGTGSTRVCRKVAWLRIEISAVHGIFLVESILSRYSSLSPPRVVASIRTLVDGNRVT